TPNRFLWLLLGLVGVLLAVVLTWPPAMTLFRFGPFAIGGLALSLAAAATVLLVMEAIKPLWRVRFRS
ncbi:MAG TPA: cation-translocating P-type ATPase, partial [Reyranella sp.]